jgi:hypothetical protein
MQFHFVIKQGSQLAVLFFFKLEKIFDAVIEDLGPVFVKFDGKGYASMRILN